MFFRIKKHLMALEKPTADFTIIIQFYGSRILLGTDIAFMGATRMKRATSRQVDQIGWLTFNGI